MTLARVCVVLALSALSYAPVAYAEPEEPATAEQVIDWIYAYSEYYGFSAYKAISVARCESAGFNTAVINGWRRGALGEVGTFQFHPRGIWWATPQARGGYSMFSPEENVAAGVWSLAHGFGPAHWVWCWLRG